MPYIRALKYQFPLISGEDVLELQRKLVDLGYNTVGQPDGIFGVRTETAVRAFQQSHNLKVDGIVGPLTWEAVFRDVPKDQSLIKVEQFLDDLNKKHSYRDSCTWHLSQGGIVIDDKEPEVSRGEPLTVRLVWSGFSDPLEEWSIKFGVPVELIMATICTETRGDPSAVREEPGYVSDESTPNKVSPGLMQTLISTARDTLGDETINREWLLVPANSIRAGTAYIARQWKATHFDPPKVACAYNAGGVYYNASENNRWKMRQYPINSQEHADRFVKWFNDCFRMFKGNNVKPTLSFFGLLQ